MKLYWTSRLLPLVTFVCAAAYGQTVSAPDILDRFLQGSQATCRLEDQAMEIEIQASLPKLKKQGTMDGLKVISSSGQVAYRFLRFTGDKLIKTDVIARFLSAEVQPPKNLGDVRITPGNYKFHFQKAVAYQGTTAYIYQVKPRKKRAGLFKGELWLDGNSARPLREAGQLVKSPSIFIQRVRFVRDYPAQASCGQPKRTSLTVQTRLVGDAEMVVEQHPVAEDWHPPIDREAAADSSNGH